MAIFSPNIFNPNIFVTGAESTSTTETSIVERKKSRGRTRPFLKFDVKKFRKVLNAYESSKSIPIHAFKPASTKESLKVQSVRLDELDADVMVNEAKELVISAASKSMDMRTVTKTVQMVSMKPKRVRRTVDSQTLVTQARELVESAQQLIEKPSLYPGKEPSLYGDVPIYFYGEVEFKTDILHSEPDECDDYNGQVFSYGPDGLEDGAPNPPLHPNCLLPNTRCEAPGGIVTGLRAWYDGPVIEVEIADGTRLTVTPNHNLLTPNGWIAADLLREGDEIIRQSLGHRISATDPDVNRQPASIEEIFISLQKATGMTTMRVPMTTEYLHGDARLCQGYIDVVAANRFLWNCSHSTNLQHAKQVSLVRAQLAPSFNTDGVIAQLLKSLVTAADSIMGGDRTSAPFFRWRLRHAQETSFMQPTLDNAVTVQDVDNPLPSATKMLSKLLDGISSIIARQKVIKVNVRNYSGYVYDLQTMPTAYMAEGIIVSNCACVLRDTKTRQILDFPGSEWAGF